VDVWAQRRPESRAGNLHRPMECSRGRSGFGMENEVVLLIIIPVAVAVGAYGRESCVSV